MVGLFNRDKNSGKGAVPGSEKKTKGENQSGTGRKYAAYFKRAIEGSTEEKETVSGTGRTKSDSPEFGATLFFTCPFAVGLWCPHQTKTAAAK